MEAICKKVFLKELFKHKKLILAPNNGQKVVANSTDVFNFWIDPWFSREKYKQRQKRSVETPVRVYEITEDVSFDEIFASFENKLTDYCLTQSQIIDFCQQYSKYLRKGGYESYFLFKEDYQFFLAYVYAYSDGLEINSISLKSSFILSAEDKLRLILPKID